MGDRLVLPRALFEKISGHALEASPAEAVGLLAGDGPDQVVESWPLPNVASLGAFLVEPYAQWQAFRAIEQAGWRAVAVYHSHPGGGAELSPADREFACRLDLIQVVLKITEAESRTVHARAYRVAGEVEDVVLVVN